MTSDDPDWLRLGGWGASATLVFGHVDGPFGLALIDTNSDGRELCLDVLMRPEVGAWQVVANEIDIGSEGTGWTSTFVYAWGKAAPGDVVGVGYRDVISSAIADAHGWWTVMAPTDPSAGDGIEPIRLG